MSSGNLRYWSLADNAANLWSRHPLNGTMAWKGQKQTRRRAINKQNKQGCWGRRLDAIRTRASIWGHSCCLCLPDEWWTSMAKYVCLSACLSVCLSVCLSHALLLFPGEESIYEWSDVVFEIIELLKLFPIYDFVYYTSMNMAGYATRLSVVKSSNRSWSLTGTYLLA